ncbi:MAG: thioredoxin family protein [Kofleriaceae bacterium]
MPARLATCPGMTITVLDFTAAWCAPCRAMTPILTALQAEYRGRIQIDEIDVDHDRDSAQRYDVRSMPTLVLLRDGREVGRVVGARSRAFVAGVIDRALAGDVAIAAP